MRSKLILIAAVGLSLPVPARAEAEKTVLRAQRDLYGFQAQQALVYEKDRLVFSRNSNFLCAPADEVLLGVFHAAYNPNRASEKALLEQITARLPATAPGADVQAGSLSPHDLKLFVGAHEVTSEQPNSLTVRRLLTTACDDVQAKARDWHADFGVVVRREHGKGGDRLRITELAGAGRGHTWLVSFKKAGCRQSDAGSWSCPVAKYGMVSFAVK
ncbi:MAG: hypothetical protein HY074_14200 [Deltaproteobacteria bacterium]|nr:hypothetical protein [Deltaproteobacteria bacterium]